jgi:hypothetical protein
MISKYRKGDSQNLSTTDVYTVELLCTLIDIEIEKSLDVPYLILR